MYGITLSKIGGQSHAANKLTVFIHQPNFTFVMHGSGSYGKIHPLLLSE
jgi:hypothetical protein